MVASTKMVGRCVPADTPTLKSVLNKEWGLGE